MMPSGGHGSVTRRRYAVWATKDCAEFMLCPTGHRNEPTNNPAMFLVDVFWADSWTQAKSQRDYLAGCSL